MRIFALGFITLLLLSSCTVKGKESPVRSFSEGRMMEADPEENVRPRNMEEGQIETADFPDSPGGTDTENGLIVNSPVRIGIKKNYFETDLYSRLPEMEESYIKCTEYEDSEAKELFLNEKLDMLLLPFEDAEELFKERDDIEPVTFSTEGKYYLLTTGNSVTIKNIDKEAVYTLDSKDMRHALELCLKKFGKNIGELSVMDSDMLLKYIKRVRKETVSFLPEELFTELESSGGLPDIRVISEISSDKSLSGLDLEEIISELSDMDPSETLLISDVLLVRKDFFGKNPFLIEEFYEDFFGCDADPEIINSIQEIFRKILAADP